jgi:hypothetical protein
LRPLVRAVLFHFPLPRLAMEQEDAPTDAERDINNED